jgi:anti-sigma regulatory factor (Ser/Thr protein kinase)
MVSEGVGAVLSGVLAGIVVHPDHAVARLRGDLRLGTAADLSRLLDKLFAGHGSVLLDLSSFHLAWHPAIQLFPAALARAGGWPAARLVLFGADQTMTTALRSSGVSRRVPLAADEPAARRRLRVRPDTVAREHYLPADVGAPRSARRFAAATCAVWDVPQLYGDAAVVISELVTNAVEHAATPTRVRLRLDGRGLWVEVHDGGLARDIRPKPHVVGKPTSRGRGLQLVAALSAQWGVTRGADGTTVWALLPRPLPGTAFR